MKAGSAQVSPGWVNTLERAILHLVPDRAKAELNARMMRPNEEAQVHE